jgi:poly [ADP-ribose] polymerase
MGKVCKLIMVTAENNNKFYDMTEDKGGSTFSVKYGRVEKTCVDESYPMAMWDKKLREKLKKGYKDVTSLYTEVTTSSKGTKQDFSAITNSQVKQLIDALQAYAKKSIQTNYTVTSDKVTEAQVTKAQEALTAIMKQLAVGVKTNALNEGLLELYHIIPRQMAHVTSHLFPKAETLKDKGAVNDAKKKLDIEQDTLDVMAGQVALNKKNKVNEDPKAVEKTMTLLEAMGLEVEEADSKAIDMIKKMMGSNVKQFGRAFKVVNKKTQKAFDTNLKDATNKQCEMFWHGSRNENWFNIISTGLLIRPSGAVYSGSAFGDGIYFASKFQKSYGYTSGNGSYWAAGNSSKAYLAVYKVRVGKQNIVHQSDGGLCYKKVQTNGCDSTYAKPGNGGYLANEEFIIYKAEQCTIAYLLEVNG